jgi:hypothetical protein
VALPGLHKESYTVTLITGDQVTLTAAPGQPGRYRVTATPQPRPGDPAPDIQVIAGGSARTGSVYAIPAQAASLITRGQVDRQLFNVGYLAAHGDTGSGGYLPVILGYAGRSGAAALTREAGRLPGTTVESARRTAVVRVAAARAADFWAAITRQGTAGSPMSTSLTDGIQKVSLEGVLGGQATRSRTAGVPLYTVTETITAPSDAQECSIAESLCPAVDLLYRVDGDQGGTSYQPSSASCSQTSCSIQFTAPAGVYEADNWMTFTLMDEEQIVEAVNPQFTVAGNTAISFDLNSAQKITVHTPKPAETFTADTGMYRGFPDGQGYYDYNIASYGADNYWVTPTQHATIGAFSEGSQLVLGKPMLAMTVKTPEDIPLTAMYPNYDNYPAYENGVIRFTGTQTLPVVYAGRGSRSDFTGINAHGKLVMIRTMPGSCIVSKSQLANARRAGAAGIVLDPVQSESLNDQCLLPVYPYWDNDTKAIRMPIAEITADEASELLGLLSRGTVKITVADSGPAPYVYDLSFAQEGQVPSTLDYSVANDQLAHVNARYHEDSARPVPINENWTDFDQYPGGSAGNGPTDYEFTSPASFTEYIGPLSPASVQDQTVITSNGLEQESLNIFSGPGSGGTEDWNEQPAVPGAELISAAVARTQPGPPPLGFWGFCSGCRQGNDFYPPLIYQGGTDPGQVSEPSTDDGTVALYEDGQEIQPTPVDGITAYQLPAKQARYQLTLHQGDTSTAWSFTSAEPGTNHTPPGLACIGTILGTSTAACRADPLVFLSYNAGLSLENTWAASGSYPLQVTAYHQAPGAPAITSLKLWTSTNGGATWTKATLTSPGKGTYTATIAVPELSATSGKVSIKAQATDAGGNSVSQTIYNAWGLTAATSAGQPAS